MNPIVIKDEPIKLSRIESGRGHIAFPDFLELNVSKDGTKGDCLIYPDTPDNRKQIVMCKCNYNRRKRGAFKDMYFTHRYETRHGEPVIVIQRIV